MASRYPGSDVDPAPLGQPLSFAFSGRTASNRFMKTALSEKMCTWSTSDAPSRGIPTEEIINLYRNWGTGGWGVILTGNIQVHTEHLEAPGNLVIPGEADAPFEGPRFEAYKRFATAGKAGGSLFIGQVSHPGRQVVKEIQPEPISASDVQLIADVLGMKFNKPHAASEQEIRDIKAAFLHAAVYLEKAGFDGIQVHGAHGYLLAQFLSQTTNLRTDKYGGSLENRARLIIEIADEIRAHTSKDFILGIKINSVEFQDRGIAPEEATELVTRLEAHQFDFVELSGGTYEKLAWQHTKDSSKMREAFFLDFAEKITPHLKQTRCYITGGLRSPRGMVNTLTTVDGVGLGRPACAEPRLPLDILSGRVKSCIQPIPGENEFGITMLISGAQMRQLSHNEQPFDSSDQKAFDGFMKDVGVWSEAMKNNATGEFFGHVRITSLPVVPHNNNPS